MFVFKKTLQYTKNVSRFKVKCVKCKMSTASTVPGITAFDNVLQESTEQNGSILAPDSGKDFDLSTFAPSLVPSFNFAAYVNNSPSLQKWIQLGVDLAKLEKKKGIPQYIMGLDFDKDMKAHIQFLHDTGVPADNLGLFLTKNPLIFKEDIETLATRTEYLKLKYFNTDMIARVVTANPHWLMFSVDRIEKRLEFFQEHFLLSQKGCVALACRGPRLITYKLEHVKATTFSVKEEMGFNSYEIKKMVLKKPKIWMINNHTLVERFHLVHNEMKIPHNIISWQPKVLLCRINRLQQRHLFLSSRGTAQYDPNLPNYVSLDTLIEGTDGEFAVNVAKSSLSAFSDFLKTL